MDRLIERPWAPPFFAVLPRRRCVELQCVNSGGVPLPAEAYHGETVAHEPGVSGVARQVPVAPVHQGHDASAAPVGDLKQQRAIAFARVLGANGDEVGRKLDLAILQIHRLVEIHDALIVRVRDRHRKIDAAGNTLVDSCFTERLAAKHITAGKNFDPDNAGFERQEAQKESDERRDGTEGGFHPQEDSTQVCKIFSPPQVLPFSFPPETASNGNAARLL